MEQAEQRSKIAKINLPVFWGSAILCILFYAPMVIFQESAKEVIDKVMFVITHSTDWMWESVAFAALVFSLWLAFSRYGNIKLGGRDDKPEFSTFTWIAMMFCGASGAGLVYWAMVEPIFYLQGPPFGIKPMSPEAGSWALAYGIFHWGFSAWGTFTIPAVAFSYMYYVRKRPYLYPSYACRGLLGDCVDGWVGKAIDVLNIIGMVGGCATALGFVIPMISRMTAIFFGVPDTLGVQILVAIVFAAMYGYSCYQGLYSGIAKLADYNTYLSFVIVLFVMIVGPTAFMFSLFSENIGIMFQNFLRMSFYTDPIAKGGFPQDWTVFYWAWWFAWAIYVGLFFTRISKGRTIRELVLNMIITCTCCAALFYLIFGSYAVDMIMNQGIDLGKVLKESGGPGVIAAILQSLPLSSLVIPVFIVVMLISQATGVDAMAYTMSAMACYEIKDEQEPPKWSRIFWATMLLFATIGLLMVGGMKVVQLSSVLTSVPILFITIILALSLYKWIQEDFGEQLRPTVLSSDDRMLVQEDNCKTNNVDGTGISAS